jgi:hypothetical protein
MREYAKWKVHISKRPQGRAAAPEEGNPFPRETATRMNTIPIFI